LLVADFGYVWDDGFKKIECKDGGDDFPFRLPGSFFTKSNSISQDSLHVGNKNFSFGKDEDFFH
jgi:hypothetical protein